MKAMKSLTNQNRTKTTMKKTLTSHKGSLVEGERVTLISLNEQREEAVVEDPFGREWNVPFEYLHIYK